MGPVTPHGEDLFNGYFAALRNTDRHTASKLVLEAVESGTDIRQLYLDVFEPALHEIGRLWQTNQISVAQEHYFTAATQSIMSQLYPFIFQRAKNGKRLVAACVDRELHEIGARMVADFFELEGWDTIFLGASTPSASIIETISTLQPSLVAVSATVPFHVDAVRELINQIRADARIAHIRVIVGGRTFNIIPQMWRKTGADDYAPNALQAVAAGNELVRRAGPVRSSENHPLNRPHAVELLRSNFSSILEETVRRCLGSVGTPIADARVLKPKLAAGVEFIMRSVDSALSMGEILIIDDMMAWSGERLLHDGVSTAAILGCLYAFRSVLESRLPGSVLVDLMPMVDHMIRIQASRLAAKPA